MFHDSFYHLIKACFYWDESFRWPVPKQSYPVVLNEPFFTRSSIESVPGTHQTEKEISFSQFRIFLHHLGWLKMSQRFLRHLLKDIIGIFLRPTRSISHLPVWNKLRHVLKEIIALFYCFYLWFNFVSP